jgi:hypothetical protein
VKSRLQATTSAIFPKSRHYEVRSELHIAPQQDRDVDLDRVVRPWPFWFLVQSFTAA